MDLALSVYGANMMDRREAQGDSGYNLRRGDRSVMYICFKSKDGDICISYARSNGEQERELEISRWDVIAFEF